MSKTNIEWCTDAWNPVTGCTPISPGCVRCYAKTMAETRLRGRHGYPADEPFRVTLHPERLVEPLRWRKPRRVFVGSMTDLFHEAIPTSFILRVFEVMAQAKDHTFMVLTKRPDRMRHLFAYGEKLQCDSAEHHRLLCTMPLPNVWLGVTVENQAMLKRMLDLQATPAAVRFLSLEPLLGPVDVSVVLECSCGAGPFAAPEMHGRLCGIRDRIDWVIAGGESGPGARPAELEWFRILRDQCQAAGVPYFLKQLGGHPNARSHGAALLDGRLWKEMPG